MTDRLKDLPWFLREYIHAHRWSGFREVQVRAFDVLFGSDDHLLISSGTSSGKTEAALFPVITSLYRFPTTGIGALYVGPLKALIDDQHDRLELLLGESGVQVTGWHGDIARGVKERVTVFPTGILQITPESLQNLIANRPDDVRSMFPDLRFVIVDEVHAFMGTDRGDQLLCCLDQLELLSGCDPRRIGLSATISDLDGASAWLAADTGRRVSAVACRDSRGCDMSVVYSHFPSESEGNGVPRKRAVTAYYERLFAETDPYNCIVFTNSRMSAERTARSLTKVSDRHGSRKRILVHHGSVSKDIRKAAEEGLKDRDEDTTTVATVTLELGIDVGDLDRVVQIDPPYTCSSLIQRMGRSGRRNGRPVLVMMCNDDDSKWWSAVQGVSMDLVKAAAMAQMCADENWTEPCPRDGMPFGLLYQQTMAYLKSRIDVRFTGLVAAVLGQYPFRNISRDDYRTLVRHMVSIEHLKVMPDRTIVIGLAGDRVVSDREFCTVFATRRELEVRCGGKVIGTVQEVPKPKERLQLAGRVWTVVTVSGDPPVIDVVESDGEAYTPWKSGVPGVHTEVMRRMRRLLMTDAPCPYLDEAGSVRLEECRTAARAEGMGDLFVETDRGYRMYPWLGTVQFDTLRRIVERVPGVDWVRTFAPYAIDIVTDLTEEELLDGIERYRRLKPKESLISDEDILEFGKYDAYVPKELLVKAFAADRLDYGFDLSYGP